MLCSLWENYQGVLYVGVFQESRYSDHRCDCQSEYRLHSHNFVLHWFHMILLRVRRRTVGKIRTAALWTMRAERFGLVSLATRADRAMRTLAARSVATNVCDELTFSVTNAAVRSPVVQLVLRKLASRPGWIRLAAGEYVCNFGGRRSRLSIPTRLDQRKLLALVTSAEINALLGDCAWPVLSHLQTLAARQLEQFLER